DYNQTGLLKRDPEYFKDKTHYFSLIDQAHVERFDTSERRRTIYPSQIKKIVGGPHQEINEITNAYVRLINEAQNEIIIGNLYFSPVDSVFKALLDAINRGVKLTVLTNGVSDIAPEYTKFFCWANRMTYVPAF